MMSIPLIERLRRRTACCRYPAARREPHSSPVCCSGATLRLRKSTRPGAVRLVLPGDIAAPEPAAPPEPARPAAQGAWEGDQRILRAQAAHALAVDYLDLWSAPNRLTLATASSFYGPTVKFHGRGRTLDLVLAEKRRFAERWPQRTYRYRPETTTVACESDGARCTVWAIFDFSAAALVVADAPLGSVNTSLL